MGANRFEALFAHVAEPLELVEQALRAQLASRSEVVALVGEHVLSAGGKRVRPALLLLAAELCGYTGPRRVQIAAAIELLHTATLLHDDVVDVATRRRGLAAANTLWGNRRAVLTGDFLYARASAMVVDDGDLDVLAIFADAIRQMAEGEILQLQFSFDPDVTETHYYDVIGCKSAALLATACEAGSILAGVTRAERRRLAEFGRELGLAFQLRDDALDYTAAEAALGKQPFTDLREGKVTLPLLLTLKRCTPAERAELAALLKQLACRPEAPDGGELHRALRPAVELVRRHRGAEDTVRRASDHVARAQSAIAPFPEGAAKRALRAAAELAATRDR